MQGFAGVVVFNKNSVLLVNEPDYFTGEPHWSFPSGHMEEGEDPATAAARELAEESGCIIDPSQLELIAIADVRQDGQLVNRSWNYVAAATPPSPSRHGSKMTRPLPKRDGSTPPKPWRGSAARPTHPRPSQSCDS